MKSSNYMELLKCNNMKLLEIMKRIEMSQTVFKYRRFDNASTDGDKKKIWQESMDGVIFFQSQHFLIKTI
ncbi:hypothetical protein EDD76_103226 [Kineothrix alysoides]|uniref:Uncharacterized protein n=1 Tax=Kineothrix alysoides TaxID=1469948 RepID=A0A4R1R3N0_9FIRM|nr:hypothetical protein [Kineothrix alysoides]TCL60034.1 hypothetical protein EDD76_103226 [Kineothrix alysoides]